MSTSTGIHPVSWVLASFFVALLIADVSGQTPSTTLYNETGTLVDDATFRGECRDLVANISDYDTISPNVSKMFCSCLRTSNRVQSPPWLPNPTTRTFTALLHALLPLGNPAQFPVGQQMLWATYITLFHLNSYGSDDLKLAISLWQTDCDTLRTTRTVADLLVNNIGTGIVGPACSAASELLNNFAPYLSMADVAYSVESSRLNRRVDYASFHRIAATSEIYTNAWIEMMQNLGWKSVSVISENSEDFQVVLDAFQSHAIREADKIEIKALESVTNDFDVDIVWSNIRRARTRVVILMMFEPLAQKIACSAYHKGFSSACCAGKTQLTFVVPGWYSEFWFTQNVSFVANSVTYNCTSEQMMSMAAHTFSMSQQLYRSDEDTVLDITNDYKMSVTRYKQLNALAATHCYAFPTIPVAYDSLMHDSIVIYYKALQLLQETLKHSNTTYRSPDWKLNYIQGQKLLAIRWVLIYLVGKVDFESLSGHVYFRKLNRTFTTNVREAQAEVEKIMENGNFSSIIGDFRASEPNRPVNATIRQRTANGSDLLIATLDPEYRIHTYLPERLTWGQCCPNSIPSDTIPETDSECTYLSESLVENLGGCSQALGFIIGFSIGLLLLIFAVVAVVWQRWYKKKIKVIKRAAQYGLDMDSTDLMEKTQALSKWELPRSSIIINRRLGEGAFGAVYGGELIPDRGNSTSSTVNMTCTGVAVKTLHDGANNEEKSQFLAEGQLMTTFDHENIVKLLGFCTKDEPFYVVMELMMHGDLKGYLLSYRHLCGSGDPSELHSERLTSMVTQIANGMAYLAELRFVHRDIAARNCMVTINYTVKIGDFGMARDMYTNDYYRVKAEAPLPVRWMARESLFDGRFTLPSDMWSFGVVVWEVITFGEMPFPGMVNGEVIEHVREGGTALLPPHCPQNLRVFINSCWTSDPESRLTGADAVTALRRDPRLVVPCVEAPRTRRNRGGTAGSMRTTVEAQQVVRRRNGAPGSSPIPEQTLARSLEEVDETAFSGMDRYVVNPSSVRTESRRDLLVKNQSANLDDGYENTDLVGAKPAARTGYENTELTRANADLAYADKDLGYVNTDLS
eukprot:scpid22897/ scgid25798/ Tyrosine-protein kinase transforming protein ros